ncbi:MAG: RNA 3'-terminal phosphate cyclase [Kangiellaceae bacterium]|nr:RNA 3'-terminal phosphate cyclase [Kangiellaceae bacterium]
MKKEQITIDGSQGEGGGQILRTSLSLSMCLKQPIRINNIRAGRKKPGLLRQHLTCVRAAQEICNATVKGDELCSNFIEFTPGEINGGEYRFAIGTAGSTSLVFQTILPALLQAASKSTVSFEGGTHNMQAPSYEFITKSFLKALEKIGPKVDCKLERYGFYPNGGGQWTAEINPIKETKRLKLLDRGDLVARNATTIISKIPLHVSQRELKKVAQKLNWTANELFENEVDSIGPGNLISLKLVYENTVELFDEVAQRGLTAERVAGKAVSSLKRYMNSKAVVGEHLADQLLLPMALNAGGSYITHAVSEHVRTNANVINQFIDDAISITEIDNDTVKIVVNGINN